MGAGGLLIYEAIQAGASTATLVRMGAYLALDSASSAIPVAGWAVDTLFRAHRMAGAGPIRIGCSSSAPTA